MARPRHEQPTPAELELLKLLWDRDGPATVREVLEAANREAGSSRAYTSVMSLLNVMADKGLVTRTPRGRAFAYEPAAPRSETLRGLLGETLDRAFDGSAALLIAHLLEGASPNRAELDAIRVLIDTYRARVPSSKPEDRRSKGGVGVTIFETLAPGGLAGRLVTLALFHGLWIGLLASAVAALALAWLPIRARRAREAALLLALVVSVVGPIVAVSLAHSMAGSSVIAAEVGATRTIRVAVGGPDSGLRADLTPNRPTSAVPIDIRPDIKPLAALANALSATARLLERLQPILLVLWFAVTGLMLMRLLVGIVAVGRIRRASRDVDEDVQARSNQLAGKLKLRSRPAVRVHPGLAEPCLIGPIRPTVLLPAVWLAAEGSDPDRLDAILAHELAHAKRLDLPLNLFQRVVEAIYWFHPAVRWTSRTLRQRRESAADALAAHAIGDPLALASALESVARSWLAVEPSQPALALPIGGEPASLRSRIQEILGMMPARPRSRSRFLPLAAFPVAALLAILAGSLGLAEEPPAASRSETRVAAEFADESETTTGRSRGGQDAGSDPAKVAELYQAGRFVVARPPETTVRNRAVGDRSGREINYEVRFISIAPYAWRETLKDRLKLVGRSTEVSAWTIDRVGIDDLFTMIQADIWNNLVQAPRASALEGEHVELANTAVLRYVADLEKVAIGEKFLLRPILDDVERGTKLDFSGHLEAGFIRVDVDIESLELIAWETLTRRVESGSDEPEQTGEYQLPIMDAKRFRAQVEIPDGSSLLVSLGPKWRDRKIPELAKVANKYLEAIDLHLERHDTRDEFLVLVTPRPVVEQGE